MFPLVIKLAFLYKVETRQFEFYGKHLEPTYRVSLQVYPVLKRPKFSAAVSEVDRFGTIKPIVIGKLDLNQ